MDSCGPGQGVSDRARHPVIACLLRSPVLGSCSIVLAAAWLALLALLLAPRAQYLEFQTPLGEVWVHMADGKVSFFYKNCCARTFSCQWWQGGFYDGNAPRIYFSPKKRDLGTKGFAYVQGTYYTTLVQYEGRGNPDMDFCSRRSE